MDYSFEICWSNLKSLIYCGRIQALHLAVDAHANPIEFIVGDGYDKLLNSYISTVALACGLIWLKL